MSAKLSRLAVAATALACWFTSAAAQPSAKYEELPKFHQVNPTLYRGAQPKEGGLQLLAELGVKTIVNLRSAGERVRNEAEAARTLGMQYYNVPLKWYGRPKDEQVEQVLRIITAPENQPVFVHCAKGVDRTGLIVAIYRIAQEGWTSAQAKAEAKHFGMHWWKFSLRSYISDYHKRLTQLANKPLAPVVVH